MVGAADRLTLPAPAPESTRVAYGLTLFLFVLEHGSPAAALLSRELAELTRYAARVATDARGASPAYYDRVAEAERMIAARVRAIDAVDAELARARELAAGAPGASSGPAPNSGGGSRVPLRPAPVSRPPGGVALPAPAPAKPGAGIVF